VLCTKAILIGENCRPLKHPSIGSIRSDLDAGYLVTPISLLLDDSVSIDDQLSFVQFPLDPTRPPSTWYTWKASAKTPLLVYDPQHTRSVLSASQLFGHWTFAGQRLASLALNASTARPKPAWKNGYEALATLDQNRDGRLSGEELVSLALWFDANQDARVQPGEVRTLAAEGIVSLFFNPDRQDAVTHNLYASVGFQKNENGRIVSGASVDWFAEHAPTKTALLWRDTARAALSQQFQKQSSTKRDHSPVQSPKLNEMKYQPSKSLGGIWKWHLESDTTDLTRDPGGYLTFRDSGARILGHSYAALPVQDESMRRSTLVLALSLNGVKEHSFNGRTRIAYEINAGSRKIVSEATLSSSGGFLRGTSVVLKKAGRTPLYQYKWSATRLAWTNSVSPPIVKKRASTGFAPPASSSGRRN